MVGLHGELKHAEAASRALCQASAKDRKEQISPQGGQGTPDSKCHMQRLPGDVLRPRPVGDTDLPARAFPAGAGAATAPGARAELELDRACHLDWGRYSKLLACCQAALGDAVRLGERQGSSAARMLLDRTRPMRSGSPRDGPRGRLPEQWMRRLLPQVRKRLK